MFDKLSKNQKVILYFLIVISFLFIVPIIFWLGVFVGYNMCKKSMKIGIQTVLETETDIDKTFLEIDI